MSPYHRALRFLILYKSIRTVHVKRLNVTKSGWGLEMYILLSRDEPNTGLEHCVLR
jgi:hypothetical protein